MLKRALTSIRKTSKKSEKQETDDEVNYSESEIKISDSESSVASNSFNSSSSSFLQRIKSRTKIRHRFKGRRSKSSISYVTETVSTNDESKVNSNAREHLDSDSFEKNWKTFTNGTSSPQETASKTTTVNNFKKNKTDLSLTLDEIAFNTCSYNDFKNVLCGNRVSQMTRTYDDIEAVTRLLEEKEKDLELTVQIGKELLQQNNRLESRITELEADLKSSSEDRQQLIHDLHQKNELISVLTNDVDDGSENETPTLSKSITLDLLQKKITSLQDENKSLKMEVSQVVKQTDEVEEQERKLMDDITTQLNSTNLEFDGLSLELERQREENRLQHEQIVSLTARLTEAEMRLHQLTSENDEQNSLLSITKENQNLLATELVEFKQRYQEVLALLQEAQEQIRNYRKKQTPHVRSGSFVPGLGMTTTGDSLHSELMESSMYSENSLDSGICTERINRLITNIPGYQKVFQTVQCATKSGQFTNGMSQLGEMSFSSGSSGPRMSAVPYTGPAGSYHRSSTTSSTSMFPSYGSIGAKTSSMESIISHQSDESCSASYPSQQPSGVPGAPGAKDLEAALKRLTPGEVLARRAMLQHAPIGTYSYDESNTRNSLPLGIRTPDSIMSTGSRLSSASERPHWRLPEKLQIVKPMEGSQTLGHWSRLATPNLGGLLEERPGVTIRGGRGLDEIGLQMYSLSDVEEDIDDLPGKQFQQSGCVYTYTTSHIMHPTDDSILNDLSFLSQSQLSSRMASTSTSRQPSCPPTPRGGLSRRNSCSTFSVNMGLASMLNERGIKAVTPSVLNTPSGPNFSPTVTPCNSPEGSPTRSMSPEPLFSGFLSQGADLIRRKLYGDYPSPQQRTPKHNKQKIMLSHLEKRALRSLKLLEKVESVGLENIIASTQASTSGVGQIASRGISSRSASPMSQLHSLKNIQSCINGMVDDISFDRNQIRSVLNKGLSNDSLRSLADSDLSSSISESGDSHTSELNDRFDIANPEANAYGIKPKLEDSIILSTTSQADGLGSASTDIRVKHMQRQKSRRNLKNGQRPDLGTVKVSNTTRIRSDLGKVDIPSRNSNNSSRRLQELVAQQKKSEEEKVNQQSMAQSFVGSISSLFFGRKGGWL